MNQARRRAPFFSRSSRDSRENARSCSARTALHVPTSASRPVRQGRCRPGARSPSGSRRDTLQSVGSASRRLAALPLPYRSPANHVPSARNLRPPRQIDRQMLAATSLPQQPRSPASVNPRISVSPCPPASVSSKQDESDFQRPGNPPRFSPVGLCSRFCAWRSDLTALSQIAECYDLTQSFK